MKENDANAGEELKTREYEKELAKLHVELVKLQEWVKHKGLKVCIIFEGRDRALYGTVSITGELMSLWSAVSSSMQFRMC